MIERLFLVRSRTRLLTVMGALALVMLTASLAWAQGDSPRRLNVGQPVTGSLNEQSFAQVFTFDGQAGTAITLTATSNTQGLSLALLLTDSFGQTLAQAANTTGAEVVLRDVQLASTGAFYVTVLRSTGAQGPVAGQFTLTLAQGVAGPTPTPTPPPTVNLTNGMTISLTWGSIDDMDLEIRDPVGGSVFFRNPSIPSGGTLRANVNNGCTNTVENPTETINWPRGNVPGGSYEILVYYNQACRQPAAPNDFTVTVSVDGRDVGTVTGRLNLNEQYVASFFLDSPTQVTVNPGGANPQLVDLRAFGADISAPTPLAGRTSLTGRIDRTNPADTYSFDGVAGQTVSIEMTALDGSLDTQLILLGPNRNVLTSNDDATAETRNSLISNQVLNADGQYIIVATRFGKDIGGTEGAYALTITSAAGQIAGNPTALPSGGTLAPGGTANATPDATGTTGGATSGIAGLPAGTITISLTWDNRADVRLLVRDPGNRSLFSDSPQVPNGGILARQDNLNCQNDVTPTPITYAYWPGRPVPGTYEVQVWMNNQCDEPILPNYVLTVSANGNNLITHRDVPDFSGNFYVTSFTIDQNGNATAGQGGIFTRQASTDIGDVTAQLVGAPALVYGTTANGTIDAANAYVLYTFQARAGDRVRILMQTARGNLDPFLFLLDSTGAQINQNDDAAPNNRNSQIDQVIPADGQYVIIATRFGTTFGGTSGSFGISVAPLR